MNETFDFVVVGSGGGSLCAALVLRAAGKSVLILEKTALVGGTTAKSGGVMWIPNNRFMKEAGVPDSRDQALAYLDAVVGNRDDAPGATRARRETYVDEAPKMVEFLISQGLKLRRIPSWPDYHKAPGESIPGRTVVSQLFDINQLGEWKTKLRPGFLPLAANLDEAMRLALFKRCWDGKKALLTVIGRTIFGKLRGKNLTTAGQALQGQMLFTALKAGVNVRINAKVKKLVEENGRVTGVIADINGTETTIGARLGVLLNAGGFARNQRMLDQYIPGTEAALSGTAEGDMGEMIEEAVAHGAAIAQMTARIGNPTTKLPNMAGKDVPNMQGDVAKPHTIIVDQAGDRYMREASSYSDITNAMMERNKHTPAIHSWMIMDSQFMAKYMLCGTMPGSKKPQAWFDEKALLQGDTLDALATQCNIDPAKLKATVERFNGFAKKGKDDDFLRGDHAYGEWLGDPLHDGPSKTLGTIDQGPFFAMKLYPGDVSTYGGLVTDTNSQVLRGDGSPIAGLYATGVTTASVFGAASIGAGASIGPSFTWGYVAAKHALANQ